MTAESVKILVIRFSSLGDIVLASPLIRRLKKKFPQGQIDFAVREKFAELVKYNPNISSLKILREPAKYKHLLELRKEINNAKYDYIIDIHGNIRSKFISVGLNGSILTWEKPVFRRWLLVKCRINLLKNYPSVPLRYVYAAGKLGIEDDKEGLEVFFNDECKQRASSILNENGLEKRRFAVLAPGAKWFTKRWDVKKFAEAGKGLLANGFDALILAGSKDEIGLCDNIQSTVGGGCYNFAGKMSVSTTAVLISKSSLFIGNDSGLSHVAGAVGTPSVVIFGPTVREFGFFPFRSNAVVIEKDINCRPCSHIGSVRCPKGHFRCMEEISVEEVLSAALKAAT